MRETHACALEEFSFFEDPRHAAAAFGALPGVAAKSLAVELLERRDDPLLQLVEVLPDGVRVHFFSARCPMSLRYCAPGKRIDSTAR